MDTMGQVGVVVGPTTRANRIVSAVTRSPACHVVVGVGNGRVVSPGPHGVLAEPAEKYRDAVWSRFEHTAEQAQRIASWAMSRVGARYAWALDAAVGVEWLLQRQLLPIASSGRRYQCAQFAGLALAAGGVEGFDTADHCRLVPASFLWLYQANAWWLPGV